MEQNLIINFANEFINNLYFDISNITYQNNDICVNNITSQTMDISSRPINISYISEDTLQHNTSTYPPFPPSYTYSSNYLQNVIYNTTTSDLSYIIITPINNNLHYPRATSIRDLIRILFVNYNNNNEEDNDFVETFINSTFENKQKFKKVISDSELEKLKPQKFNKINETTTNSQCPILYYNFEEDEEIIKLPCNHNYNCEAIIKWLSQESNTCPVCRHEFDYKEITINSKIQEQEEQEEQEEQDEQEENEHQSRIEETRDIYNLFSNEEILMQEILLNSYSNM
jgi:hypothetical protein